MYNFKKPHIGETIKGTVMTVKEDVITLNINYVCDATMYKDNYSDDQSISLVDLVHEGDIIEAVVKKIVETDENQQVYLSRLPLIKKEYFTQIEEKFKNNETITVKVVKAVNKGFIATAFEHEFFLPEGQTEFNTDLKDKEAYIGKTFEVKITDVDKKKQRLVVSRKALLAADFKNIKAKEFDDIKVNDVLKGKVEKFMPFGAFISFGHNQGLLRLSQITHTHFNKIEDVLTIGEEIEVKVIKKEDGKIDLSRKALLKTPYEIFAESNKASDVVTAKVVQKLPFGLVMELASDVTGLLHKNEFTWNPNDNSIAYVKLNDEIKVAILSLDPKAKKISLSKKALEDNPWSRITIKKYEKVQATVSKIVTGKGLEVLCDGVTGFIPASELTSGDRISKIEDFFAIGDTVEAYVTDLIPEEWVLKLSIRRLQAEVEKKEFEKYMKEANEETPEVTIGDIFKDILKK